MMVFILRARAKVRREQREAQKGTEKRRDGPVCDCEDGLLVKPLPDGLLQQCVRLLVHAGRGLINTQELHGGGFGLLKDASLTSGHSLS